MLLRVALGQAVVHDRGIDARGVDDEGEGGDEAHLVGVGRAGASRKRGVASVLFRSRKGLECESAMSRRQRQKQEQLQQDIGSTVRVFILLPRLS